MLFMRKELEDAIDRDDESVLKNCLSSISDIAQDELDECLIKAMPQSSLKIIEILFEAGAILRARSFWPAIHRDDPKVIQLLQKYGFDLNTTEFGRPAVAVALGHETLLRWLLDHGADPNIGPQKRAGWTWEAKTPVASAAKLSHPQPLLTLLSYGAKMDPEAMFHAIGMRRQRNGTATMQVLLEHGVDVNCVSQWGTPLFHAIHVGDREKVEFLLEQGADPRIRVFKGKVTAFEYAAQRNRTELLELLQQSCP